MDHEASAHTEDLEIRCGSADAGDETTFELHVGAEHIQVIVDAWGIRFRHPNRQGAQGRLTWGAALALSLLPADRAPAPRRETPLPRG